jgi:hypothetical protein
MKSKKPLTPSSSISPTPPNIPSTNSQNSLPVLGLVLAVILPPIGLVVSIIAWRKTVKNYQGGKKLAIVGAIMGSVLSLALIVLGALLLFESLVTTVLVSPKSSPSQSNQAQSELNPILAQIVQLGGQKICDQGDSGHSLDNNIPNYSAYYKVSDNQLLQRLETTAMQQGFTLAADTNTVNQLQVPDTQPNSEHYNSSASYLTATNGGKKLDITIDRNGSLPLNCTVNNDVQSYGKSETVSGSTDLVKLYMTLPATN